jgi:hypothetical protein
MCGTALQTYNPNPPIQKTLQKTLVGSGVTVTVRYGYGGLEVAQFIDIRPPRCPGSNVHQYCDISSLSSGVTLARSLRRVDRMAL